MKKILVVLLILSVAWGVFAQDGSWRVSGNVEVGTRLNFEPTPWDDGTTAGDLNNKAVAGGIAYNSWDAARGRFALIYGTYVNDGALSTGFKWNTRGEGEENNPFFSYNGENFSFSTDLYGTGLLVSQRGGATGDYIHRLWGNYKFVNGLVFIQAAYKAEEEEFWISDTTAGGGALGAVFGGASRNTDKVNHHNFFGKPSTFTYNDGGNYLLGDVRLSAISFGLMIPNLLGGKYNYYAGYGALSSDRGTAITGKPEEAYFGKSPGLLVDDILKNTVFGVKFSMSPIEFAGQFKVRDAGAYIGAKFFAGPLTVGASFSGILSPEDVDDDGIIDTAKFFKVGGDLNFNGGVFAAGLAGSYERLSDANETSIYGSLIRVQPRFSYNVIPSHLCFALDAGFYFLNVTDGDVMEKDITWAVQPQLFWTFLGTGARNGYGWAGPFYQGGPTGIIARYRVVSAAADWRQTGYLGYGGLGAFNGNSAWTTSVEKGGWMPFNALDIVFQFNF